MLVDIVTAFIALLTHFVFALVKPVQVEQMTAIIVRIRFFQWQAKSGLTIIDPIKSYKLCTAGLEFSLKLVGASRAPTFQNLGSIHQKWGPRNSCMKKP